MKKEQYHEIDRRISSWMERWGHMAHRISLALVFLWFGSLKLFGYKSASSLIAHTIYVSTPDVMIPLIGIWELSIGFLLLFHSYVRVALLLLFLRLPGTLLALILKAEVCFIVIP